jgi:hypothetical protein
MAYIFVDVSRFGSQSWEVGSNTSLDERLIDLSQTLSIRQWVLRNLREVEPKRTVQLNIDQPWRYNPSSQIDRLIWNY